MARESAGDPMTQHEQKYEALAQRLGVKALAALVPFSRERIEAALAAGDEHLNTLPLSTWDARHGTEPGSVRLYCGSCAQALPYKPQLGEGVWGLVRRWIGDGRSSEAPRRMWWSLSDTVCVLKHVATHYIAEVSA